MKTAVIIPARYASTRLEGKPLLKVKGMPIIQHVYLKAKQSSADVVIVATDDERIKTAVEEFGGICEMTSVDCQSGSDRIATVAKRHDDFEYIVNLQGDEPQIKPEAIDLVIKSLKSSPEIDISTLIREIEDKEQIENPNCVKCVVDNNFNAMYFSRCPIPYPRNPKSAKYYAHIGIYGYKRSSLLKMCAMDKTDLENQESLEQLRALQNGMKIKTSVVDFNPIGIDTKEDYEKFKKICEGCC